MADITISSLTQGIPAGNNVLPYSTGSVTLGAPVSDLFKNSLLTVGNGTGNYVSGFTQLGQNGVFVWHDNATKSLTATGLSVAINRSEHPAAYLTNATGNALIVDAGNVGIGTTTPSTKLDVNGTIKATGLQVPGTVIQVLQAVYDDEADVATLNRDWTDVPNLTVNITPRSTNSKIHLRSIIHQVFGNPTTCNFRFMRNSTIVGVGRSGAGANGTSPVDVASFRNGTSNAAWCNPAVGEYIDSPNTASQITYKVMYKPYYSDSRTMRWNNSFGETGDRFRVISTLTVSEIAG